MSNKYTTISLPKKFADHINEFIESHPELGYSSNADFVKEAVRKHLKEKGIPKIKKPLDGD